jgi:hypothetical protein
VPNHFIVYLIISFNASAHDDEVNIERDFPNMFENAQTNQIVDPYSFNDALTNVINRWGFQLEVEHQTYARVAKLRAREKFTEEQVAKYGITN